MSIYLSGDAEDKEDGEERLSNDEGEDIDYVVCQVNNVIIRKKSMASLNPGEWLSKPICIAFKLII